MGYSDDELNDVYDKKKRKCIYCGVELAFINYGGKCRKGAWEVDHSKPFAKDGTDHPNNRVPACYVCNRAKGDRTARAFRKHVERNWGKGKRGWSKFRQKKRREYCG